jgi:hypothetical protein
MPLFSLGEIMSEPAKIDGVGDKERLSQELLYKEAEKPVSE